MTASRYVFIHFRAGETVGGVERYGRILAAQCGEVVEEWEVDLRAPLEQPPAGGGTGQGRTFIFQFSPNRLPDESIAALEKIMASAGPADRGVVILHDANQVPDPLDGFFRLQLYRRPRSLWRALRPDKKRQELKRMTGLHGGRMQLVVFSESQRQRLAAPVRARSGWVPHFVEARKFTVGREAARTELNLRGKKVLTILGFVDPRKNNEFLIRTLAHLPADYCLVLAGATLRGIPDYPQQLLSLATSLGLAGRVSYTGYLEDRLQAVHVAATDIALCWFKSMSASGSLSTWTAGEVPIVANHNPELQVYNQLAPGSLLQTDATDSAALARFIQSLDETALGHSRAALGGLREKLSVPQVWRQLTQQMGASAPSRPL